MGAHVSYDILDREDQKLPQPGKGQAPRALRDWWDWLLRELPRDFFGPARACAPCAEVPGSEDKVLVLAGRYERRECLFCGLDAGLPEHLAYHPLGEEGAEHARGTMIDVRTREAVQGQAERLRDEHRPVHNVAHQARQRLRNASLLARLNERNRKRREREAERVQRALEKGLDMTEWVARNGRQEIRVKAYTKGEARARAKQQLGLSPRERLPLGWTVERAQEENQG